MMDNDTQAINGQEASPEDLYAHDALTNAESMLGTMKDKMSGAQWAFSESDPVQLEMAYRSSWLARKVVDIPAEDATRMWREWAGEPEDVERIVELEGELQIQAAVREALWKARLYGGCGLVLGLDSPSEELLVPESVGLGQLKFVRAISSRWLEKSAMEVWDPESPKYGLPERYWLHFQDGRFMELDSSRVCRIVPRPLPDERMESGTRWGDSVLEAAGEAIRQAATAAQAAAAIIQEAKVDVVQVPGLLSNMQSKEYADAMMARFLAANASKSIVNALLLDDKETWSQTTAQYQGMEGVLRMFLLMASGAADIPATRMLGQSPAGLSATGESDLRNYYDNVRSMQSSLVGPAIRTLDECLVRSALGTRPDGLSYRWRSLWQETPGQMADTALKHAQAFAADAQSGLLDPVLLGRARESQLAESAAYPGFAELLQEQSGEGAEADEQGPEGMEHAVVQAPERIVSAALVSAVVQVVKEASSGAIPADAAGAILRVALPSMPEEDIAVLARKAEESAESAARQPEPKVPGAPEDAPERDAPEDEPQDRPEPEDES